jgi:hypothetical protein
MPWKALRSNTAGGRKSRRHSFFENRDPPPQNGEAEGYSVESIAGPADIIQNEGTCDRSCHAPSRDFSPLAKGTPHTTHDSQAPPEQLRPTDAAKITKNHRFSLLKFRHASDPQLSRSYTSSAPILTPPLPKPPSKCRVLCN